MAKSKVYSFRLETDADTDDKQARALRILQRFTESGYSVADTLTIALLAIEDKQTDKERFSEETERLENVVDTLRTVLDELKSKGVTLQQGEPGTAEHQHRPEFDEELIKNVAARRGKGKGKRKK